ncbi:glycosyltransferase family 2 protein [Candidatus Woesearchaeota archaeon]|nr:glycosyltransferase family 2 protein [Candidatus Woesearchaeota archaeon]
MDLSIIIPVYNTEKYLVDCINSAVSLDINKEIIIINDGSTDNGEKIILDYANKYSCVKFFSIQNSGAGLARNVGLKHATGDYIFFMDSDDLIKKSEFEIAFKKTLTEQVDISFFKADFFLDNIPYKNLAHDKKHLERYFNKEYYKIATRVNILEFANAPKHHLNYTLWQYFFKKEIIDTNKIIFDNVRVHEDDLFITRFQLYSKYLLLLNNVCYSRRFRKNSLTTEPNYLFESCKALLVVSNKLTLLYKKSELNDLQKTFLMQTIKLEIFRCVDSSKKLKARRPDIIRGVDSFLSENKNFENSFENKFLFYLNLKHPVLYTLYCKCNSLYWIIRKPIKFVFKKIKRVIKFTLKLPRRTFKFTKRIIKRVLLKLRLWK